MKRPIKKVYNYNNTESEYSGRNWYGERKRWNNGVYKKKRKSMFYEIFGWFETWVIIFLLGLISIFIYLS